ncbi:hypothetical protein GQ53DRAFT_847993 [Thozetella sp. PMI_491]|nr:hypothetical protein GQ53DRAFT_847993 [Thozetella sp. PMI_491]
MSRRAEAGDSGLQYYCRPGDGKLTQLCVQSFQDPSQLPEHARWTRVGKSSCRIPSQTILSHWIWSSTLIEGSDERNYTIGTVLLSLLKCGISLPLFFGVVGAVDFLDFRSAQSPFQILTPKEEWYDAVPSCEPELGTFNKQTIRPGLRIQLEESGSEDRNEDPSEQCISPRYVENIRLSTDLRSGGQPESQPESRSRSSLRPRYLCFLDNSEAGYTTRLVADYTLDHGDHIDTEFVFVSYTRLQFSVAGDEDIGTYEYPNAETREAYRQLSKMDRQTLAEWGVDAARAAGKQAFWLDFECVRDDDGVSRSASSSHDVYRICDIVRAAHSMVIAIGPPISAKAAAILSDQPTAEYNPNSITPWLQQWGSRLWTLPELLLCPNEHRIKLYVVGNPNEPKALAKRNFAERAWEDGESVKELVDHFEGSAILSPLHLIETALACFSRRKTDQFARGDIAYAIMGLFPSRQRPKVDQTDSGFQAFARLSLISDDGGFLERLLCLRPRDKSAMWFETDDYWGASLHDIKPICHVTDVAGPDTVELNGTYGAMIRWDALDTLVTRSPNTSQGQIAYTSLITFYTTTSLFPIIGALCLAILLKMADREGSSISSLALRYICPFVAPVVVLAIPVTLLMVWSRSKPCLLGTARLVGIEGYVETRTIERYLFGFNYGRLTEVQDLQEALYYDDEAPQQTTGIHGDEHAFTLVDTHLNTVTRIRSRNPPVAAFLVGQENGMQRALLCSYNHQTNTYVRETVTRMSNRALEKMEKTDKIRLSLNVAMPPFAEDRELCHGVGENEGGPEDANSFPGESMPKDSGFIWPIDSAVILFSLTWRGAPGILLSQQGVPASYALGFLAMQLPAYLFLRKFQIQRALPIAALIRGRRTVLAASLFKLWWG